MLSRHSWRQIFDLQFAALRGGERNMMNILRRFRNAAAAFRETVELGDAALLEMLGISSGRGKNLSEVTYYTCLKLLSETIGKMPIKMYQTTKEKGKIRASPNRALYLASVRPNPIMTPATFWSAVEANTEHYGNGYVWMRKQKIRKSYGGSEEHLDWWVLPSRDVSVVMDDSGVFGGSGRLYYRYTDQNSGELYVFPQDDVMHFKTWMSFDGIMGKPVSKILEDTVSGSMESQGVMNNLYRNGMTASMAIQYTSNADIDEKIRTRMQKKLNEAGTGARNAGKIIPIPAGLSLQPIKMTLADSQFFELRKYSALQIAAAFGIKPNQINNYDKSSYANSETQQLAFLVDTMLYRLKMYEEELNYKALTYEELETGIWMKFNEKAILRTDSKTQMVNLTSAVDRGLYTVNEARDFLDKPDVECGDIPIVNGTYIPLTMVGKQYGDAEKEGEPEEEDVDEEDEGHAEEDEESREGKEEEESEGSD